MQVREYEQPSNAPVPKVAAVGQAGTAIGAIVTLLALTGVIVPEGLSQQAEMAVQAAFVIISFGQSLLTFLAGYFKKDAKPAPVVQEIKEIAAKEAKEIK